MDKLMDEFAVSIDICGAKRKCSRWYPRSRRRHTITQREKVRVDEVKKSVAGTLVKRMAGRSERGGC